MSSRSKDCGVGNHDVCDYFTTYILSSEEYLLDNRLGDPRSDRSTRRAFDIILGITDNPTVNVVLGHKVPRLDFDYQ